MSCCVLAGLARARIWQRGALAPRSDHKHQVSFQLPGETAVRSCVCGIRARADPFSQGSALAHFPYPNGYAMSSLPGGPECPMANSLYLDYSHAAPYFPLIPRGKSPQVACFGTLFLPRAASFLHELGRQRPHLAITAHQVEAVRGVDLRPEPFLVDALASPRRPRGALYRNPICGEAPAGQHFRGSRECRFSCTVLIA